MYIGLPEVFRVLTQQHCVMGQRHQK